MIIDENIKIKGNVSNIEHFKNLGYDIKINEYIEIKVKDLLKKSHVIVNVKCNVCNDERNITYFSYCRNIGNGTLYTCPKCSKIKSKKTSMERYGVEFPIQLDEFKQKRKRNNIEKYGVDEPAKLKEFIDKVKETKKIKYGDETYTNIDKSKETKKIKYGDENYYNLEKCKKTNLEKYGTENVFQNDEIKNKKKETFLKHYGVDNYSKSEKYKNIKNNKILNKYENINAIETNNDIIKLECDQNENHNYDINIYALRNRIIYKTVLCTICNPISSNTNSGYEIQLQDFIKENYNDEIILNNREIIKPNELDIYLPKLKLAFEFNGLYWHNELNKKNDYHLNKTEECEKQGIKLIHIYEDDWIYKQYIIKSRISNFLGKSEKIFARKCKIKEISDNKLIREFLEKNHLQGFVGSKIKIGLFYNEELVSLMTFGSFRVSMGQKSTEGTYEMLRFCNKLNTNVIGGASRLFKYFINQYKPIEVISYADRSWSSGDLYEKLEFKLIHKTKPNYYYIVNRIKKYRFLFKKDTLIKEGADSNKSEHEIMLDRKIYRIYDSGHLKYSYK